MRIAHELLRAADTGIRVMTFRPDSVEGEIVPAASHAAHGLFALGLAVSLATLGGGTAGDLLLAGVLGVALYIATGALVAWAGPGSAMASIMYHGGAMSGLAALTSAPMAGGPGEMMMVAWMLAAWIVWLGRGIRAGTLGGE